MTMSNPQASTENRLDQIEQLLVVFAQQAMERDAAVHARMDELAAQAAERDAAARARMDAMAAQAAERDAAARARMDEMAAQAAERDAAAHARMDEMAAQAAERDAAAHARMDKLTQAVDNLTASMVELREGQALILQIFREEQDKREETRQDIRAMQSQIMGLQTENRRMLERLEQRGQDKNLANITMFWKLADLTIQESITSSSKPTSFWAAPLPPIVSIKIWRVD